jgi:protease-4
MKFRIGSIILGVCLLTVYPLTGEGMGIQTQHDGADPGLKPADSGEPLAPEGKTAPEFPATKARYLELSLNSRYTRGQLSYTHTPSLMDLLRIIGKAREDKHILGILLNTSGFSAGREYLWELRSALEDFRASGKRVVAFIDTADFDLYYLASAADRIVMDPAGTLFMQGYSWGRAYMQQTLEKLGVGVRELRYLDYKSAMETYTRSSLSEADRLQYDALLEDTFTLTRNVLLRARSLGEGDLEAVLNREFLYSPRAALDRGLVDALGREDALNRTIAELEGKSVRNFVCFGNASAALLAGGRHSRFYRLPGNPKGILPSPEIALVYASGETDLERGMKTRELARTIREVSQRSAVKAMVVRINSPGGSAAAADYIAQAIVEVKKRIPVVVSMGAVAASGGYWAGMYADRILASPYTLTGSIGVIGSWFYDKGLYDKLGFSVDTLQRGDHADLMTGIILPRRDMRPDEEERYRRYILDLYDEFVEKAAAGRKMQAEAVEPLARGRVYSGAEAQRLGLVDGIGGLREALDTARQLAEIPEKRKVLVREYPRTAFFDTLLSRVFSSIRAEEPELFSRDIMVFPGMTVFPAALWEHVRYRISRNGLAMPILPLSFMGEAGLF